MSSTESYLDRWKDGKKIFAIVLSVNIAAILLAVFLPVESCDTDSTYPCITKDTALFAALGIIVVVSLIGFLSFFNRLSHSPDLTKGEMRKTFAISIIMLYLLILSLVLTNQIDLFPLDPENPNDVKLTKQAEFNQELLENFSYVVMTVIIFYFGSRAYNQARKSKKDEQEEPSTTDEIDAAEADSALAEAEVSKAKAATSVAESEVETAKAEVSKAEVKSSSVFTDDEKIKAEAEIAIAKEKVVKAEAKALKAKSDEAKAEIRAELAAENEKSVKRSIKSKSSSLDTKTKVMLAKIEATKAENEAILAKTKAEAIKIESEMKPKPTTVSLKKDTISSTPSDAVKNAQLEIFSDFVKFVDDQGDKVTGKDILDFKRKFTEKVGDLIRKENDSINDEISKLDIKDPEMPKKKQMLLERKSKVTNNLAITKEDRVHVCNTLNDIMQKHVPNLSLNALLQEMDLTHLTAREISEMISEGILGKIHIGKKSPEVLLVEYFSLKNSYHPQTMTDNEKKTFNEKLKILTAEINQLPKDKQEELFDKVDDMLNP